MAKIKLKSTIISNNDKNTIETLGIKSKNKITYKENNIFVTILIYNNKIKMKRYCDEYKIEFLFELNKKTKSLYTLNSILKTFNLNTYTKKIDINNNLIKIDYLIEDDEFSYVLEMEDL
ncbi:MAG: DUF1934 family protein [bacterium]|nr:DUF1934 family protein [bacterium]